MQTTNFTVSTATDVVKFLIFLTVLIVVLSLAVWFLGTFGLFQKLIDTFFSLF